MLFVFGKDEKLVAVLSNKDFNSVLPTNNPNACPYFDAEHLERLNGEVSFNFSVPFSHPDAVYIVEENLVAFKDMDGAFQLFVIRQVEEAHNGEKVKTAWCEPAWIELLDEIVDDKRPSNVSASLALTDALMNTRWQVGTVDNLGTNGTNFYYESSLSSITKVANVWKGELRFRVNISGTSITGFYVDLLTQRGSVTGKRFEYTKDITSIKRKVDSSNLKTALYGRGKGEETGDGYGRRTTFKDIVWATANGDPVNKPLGQEWVGDPTALTQFGRPGNRHRFGVFEDREETDPATLLLKTWNALQFIKTPLVQYEMSVIDLERLTGYDHEKVRLGDTVYCIDREFNPALTVTARVIEIKRRIDAPEQAEIKLGNFMTTIADETSKMKEIEQVINDKSGQWDDKLKAGSGIQTSWLEGEISALQNQVNAGAGTVKVTENDGIIITDSATNPARALRLLGGILAIANSKDGQGNWEWRTFGTGDGFTADLITSGRIRAGQVEIGSGTTFLPGYDPSTKTTVVRSAIAPTSPAVDDLWLDTSVTPNVLYRWNGSVWAKATPTTADEIAESGTRKWAGESGADVTGSNTALDVQNVAGISATSVKNATNNFSARNDRISTTPANPVAGTVSHTINTDGSANVSFQWTFTNGSGANNIDGFYVYVKVTDATATVTGTASDEKLYIMDMDKRAIILPGVPANKYLTFAVQAFRVVDQDINANGILKSSLIQVTSYRPSANVAFNGDITGTINGTAATTVVGNASAGKTAKDKIDAEVGSGTIETTTGSQGKANTAESNAKTYVDNTTGNLINNTTKSGTLSKWNVYSNSGGATYQVINKDFGGVVVPVQECTTSGDWGVQSDMVEIDPSKFYEFSLWTLANSDTVGTIYFGFYAYDASDTLLNVKQVKISDGTVLTDTNNPYFWYGDNSTTEWVKRVGYICPAGTPTGEIKGLGVNVDRAFIIPANCKKLRFRWLNYYNAGTSKTAWIANPKMVETTVRLRFPATGLDGAVQIANNALQVDSYFFWDSTGFHAIDPNNQQRRVRITSGGIGVSMDGGASYTTAMTGAGIVANVITSGLLRLGYDVVGGTLPSLEIYDANNNLIGSFGGAEGSSSILVASKVIANNIVQIEPESRTVYVNSATGNDGTANGTSTYPFRTIGAALDSISKFVPYGVAIELNATGTFWEDVFITGFVGGGGFKLQLNTSTLYGTIVVQNNSADVSIWGTSSTSKANIYAQHNGYYACIYARNNNYLGVWNVYCNSQQVADYGTYWAFGNYVFRDSSSTNGKLSCVCCVGSQLTIRNIKGKSVYYGIYSAQGSTVGIDTDYSTVVPNGVTLWNKEQGGGRIGWTSGTTPVPTDDTYTSAVGSVTTQQWSATLTGSYRYDYNIWRTDNDWVYQGKWDIYGHYTGCIWFDNTSIRSTLSGKTIKSARLYLHRANEGGSSTAQSVNLNGVTNTGKSGTPNLNKVYNIIGSWKWGEAKWVTIPNSVITDLVAGTINGIAFNNGIYNYLYMDGVSGASYKPKLEVTFQ